MTSEAQIVKQAQERDQHAFTRLVKQYESLVYSFAFKVCRDKQLANETWQDTFVNVYRKLHQFDGKSKFTTWLYSIVANICRMKRRKSKLHEASISIEASQGTRDDAAWESGRHLGHAVTSWKDTPLETVMDNEMKAVLDRAIQKLPMDYRVVFILRDVEGLSAEETGRILKLSVPAVKSRLRRARVFLRERLNPYMTS